MQPTQFRKRFQVFVPPRCLLGLDDVAQACNYQWDALVLGLNCVRL